MTNAPAGKKLRVLVVDDSRIVRHIITDALSASTDIQVVGHASNGEQALRRQQAIRGEAYRERSQQGRDGPGRGDSRGRHQGRATAKAYAALTAPCPNRPGTIVSCGPAPCPG